VRVCAFQLAKEQTLAWCASWALADKWHKGLDLCSGIGEIVITGGTGREPRRQGT